MYLTEAQEVKYYVAHLGGKRKKDREEKNPTKTGVVMVPIKHLKCTVECTTKQPNTIFSYIKYVRSLAKMSKSDGFQDKSK